MYLFLHRGIIWNLSLHFLLVLSFIIVNIFPFKLTSYLKYVDSILYYFSAKDKLLFIIYAYLLSNQILPSSLKSELPLLRIKINFALICELHSLILLGNWN